MGAREVARREVAGWVREANPVEALERLSGFVGYLFDDLDRTALAGALEDTDDECDRWFEYPWQGSPPLTVRLARVAVGSEVLVIVMGGIDDVLAARIETLWDLS
jgi:hypothetical protein